MKQTHLVTILGRAIPVKSSASEAKVREIERFVNGRIEEISTRLTSADPQLAVILAFLNLAEQYLEQQALPARDPSLDSRVNKMLDRLDKALEANGLFRET